MTFFLPLREEFLKFSLPILNPLKKIETFSDGWNVEMLIGTGFGFFRFLRLPKRVVAIEIHFFSNFPEIIPRFAF